MTDAAPQESVLYHGTCVSSWSKTGADPLYLTRKRDDAVKYANEWANLEEAPLVFAFDTQALLDAGLALEPNWETVDQLAHLNPDAPPITWQISLSEYGTVCIPNFPETAKTLAKAVETAGAQTEVLAS